MDPQMLAVCPAALPNPLAPVSGHSSAPPHARHRPQRPSLHPHHVRRLEHVVDFIDGNLPANLSLDCLAGHAAISPFHFHRLFQAWTGETVNEFVRRRRLETAAGRLHYCPAERVIEVSLQCGFASSEAFARAFREHFHMSPSQWRAGGWKQWQLPWARPDVQRVAGGLTPCQVDVRRHAPFDLLYLRARGDYARSSTALWERFRPWAEGLDITGRPQVSIGLDDPTITAPERCRLDVGVQLPDLWADPGIRALRRTVSGGLYACLQYSGLASELAAGWGVLLNDWLHESPFSLGDGHCLAVHAGPVPRPDADWLECELRMPVKLRAN